MKLAILLLFVGLETPFFGEIRVQGAVCPESSVTLHISARTGEIYQWEFRANAAEPWQSFQSPISLSGSELLATSWPTNLLPAEIRVKSWRADAVWYSSVVRIEKPSALTPPIQGSLRVCTGQDARMRVDFPPNGTWQWERWSQGQFVALGESSKFTRTQQAELVIRGTAGVDDQSVFRCRWTSPEGCTHYSQPSTLRINQLSTLSPTPSTTICQHQSQWLRTANIQGDWIKNDWFLADSLGILRSQPDSSGRSFFVNSWPLHLRNIQVRGWFTTQQRFGEDTLTGTCSLLTNRTYTVTTAPSTPADSLYTQCGLASVAIQPRGGDWSFSKLGPWQTTPSILHFTKPDTITRWHRVRNAAGCLSLPYSITVQALPLPNGSIVWAKDFTCAADTLLPVKMSTDDSTRVRFRWREDSLWSQQPRVLNNSSWLSWKWQSVQTGCFSQPDSLFIQHIPRLKSRVHFPANSVCPEERVVLAGSSSDSTAHWTWFGLDAPRFGNVLPVSTAQDLRGMVQIQNSCEVEEKAWQILIEPEIQVNLISQPQQEVCLGDSTVWEVHVSKPVEVNWFSDQLGEVTKGVRWVGRGERAGEHKVWYQWTDSCGRVGYSDILTWTIHPTPERPSVADTLQLCQGDHLPTSSTPDRWIWAIADPVSVGEAYTYVHAESPLGCRSDSKQVFLGVSSPFNFTLTPTQDWVCTSGLRNRRVFVQNASDSPVQWLTAGVQNFELGGWFIDQAGLFVAKQQRGWCIRYDTIFVAPKQVSPWNETLPSLVSYCPSSAPILTIPKEDGRALYWYETSFQEQPVFNGNAFERTSRLPIWVRKREYVQGEQFCESEAIRIVPSPLLAVRSKINRQDRCRGNTASFEVETQGNGAGQWWQKKPNDTTFIPIPNAHSTLLRLQNIGSSTHPDQSRYSFTWNQEDCLVRSDDMLLTAMGFVQSLSSQEVCAGRPFPLVSPTKQGELVSVEWQSRSGTSEPWVVQSPPNVVEPGSQFWRIRGQFLMENGQTCTQTSDDARVQVHTARGKLEIRPDSCPGQPAHFNWIPETVGGLITWVGNPIGQSSGRLSEGEYRFQYQIRGCVWDTTFAVNVAEHVVAPPTLPPFTQLFLGDSTLGLSLLHRPDLRWFTDSLATQWIAQPRLDQVGPFAWYASLVQDGCVGPTAVWRGRILQPLHINTSKTYVHQCSGQSIDLTVQARGEGPITYQWFQSADSLVGWTPLTTWSSRHRGEQTTSLRLYSVGSFPHLDGRWYRCLIRDEFGESWSDPIRLEVWDARGSLLPHQFVCEGTSQSIDIRAFRGWRNNETSAYWEQRTSEGWVFWKAGFQLALHEQPEAEYRYVWEFQNSNQETCRQTSDSFRIQRVNRPEPPHETRWTYCQEPKSISAPLSGSQFSWYEFPEQTRITSTSTPRISLHAANEMIWWVARKGTYCESVRVPVQIQIHPRPEPPVSSTPRESIGYSLQFSAVGEQLKWYRTTRSGSQLDPPSFNQPGLHRFYVTQTNVWGCESPQHLIESRLSWPARIRLQPQSLYECDGNMVTFQVRMEGAGQFQYQWFQAKGKGEFHPIQGATGQDLRIPSAGSIDFPDSSRFFCSVKWEEERQLVSDTVFLWTNTVSSRPSARSICPDAEFALEPSMVDLKGNVRQFFWEIKDNNQWISKMGLAWPLDSFPSARTTVRARVIFQSELRETCTRTSGEFTLTRIPQRLDGTLPPKLVSCDTAQVLPIVSHWQWQKKEAVDQIRSKLDTGCWSDWSDVVWEKHVCWADGLTCEHNAEAQLTKNWENYRLPSGLVWAKARGAGSISARGSFQESIHWLIKGKGEVEPPPSASDQAQWVISTPKIFCDQEQTIWEVKANLADLRTWVTDSSVSVSYGEIPKPPSFDGVPKVEGTKFWWMNAPSREWQRWDPIASRWLEVVFPVDTALLSSSFRYRHWHSSSLFEWILVPRLRWTDIPAVCVQRGTHNFHHNLHFPLQAEVRTTSGQLIQSFLWSNPTETWPLERRSFAGPMKILTFTDVWGRTCTIRQWSD